MIEERPHDFLIRSCITPENNYCTMTIVHLPSGTRVDGETWGSQYKLRDKLEAEMAELLKGIVDD
jgi:hypothetical protein